MTSRSNVPPFDADAATASVVRVGDGRGFVVQGGGTSYILTAAHCLPELPPAHPWAYLHEKTYKIIGPLHASQPTLLAECVFADPMADLAVLTAPDSQELSDEWEAFTEVIDTCTPFQLSRRMIRDPVRAWLLSLDGEWHACQVTIVGSEKKNLLITDAKNGIVGGTSGSPIILDDGTAIGLVSTSGGSDMVHVHTGGGPQPRLAQCLPVWLMDRLKRSS